jgi:hypothetical protein
LNVNKEILSSLSSIERLLLQRTQILFTRGKQGKRAPVILTEEVVPIMTQLANVKLREKFADESNHKDALLFANKGISVNV